MIRARETRSFGCDFKSRRTRAAAMAAILAGAAVPALAGIPGLTNQFTNGGSGDWTDPADWSYGLAPTYADNTGVATGTATITTGDNAQAAFLAIDGTAALNMTGGNFTSISDVRSGNVAGDNASFTQSGGNLTITGRGGLWAAQAGSGTVTLSGGTTTVGTPTAFGEDYGDLLVGNGAGSVGTLNINGGTLTNYALVIVGRNGATGNINMTAGTWNAEGDFGHSTGTGKVTINQSGGTINVGGFVSYPRSTATLIGSFSLGIGNTAATKSVYTMSGTAQLNVNAHMYIGGTSGSNPSNTSNSSGFADLVMNGGTITLGNANNQTGSLYVGSSTASAAATGTVTLNSPSASITAPAGVVLGQRQTTGASTGTGTLTINSGQVLTPKSAVTIGRVAGTQGANGTLNLAGGLLQANSIIWVKPSTGTPTQVFNWTGGQLNINSAQADYAMVNNGGTLAPGVSAPGAFVLTGANGSYTQNATGTFAVDLASDSSYDSINATGGAVGAISLAGTVNATLGSGYTPGYGSTYQVLAGKSVADSATWNLPAIASGLTWDQRIISEGGNQLELLSIAPSSTTPLSAGSWTGPGSIGAGYALTGSGGSVSVDANVTAGYLQVGGTGNWSIGGSNTLTFSASSGRAGLTAFGNTTTINAPINFTGDGAIGAASAGTAVTVGGTISGSGTITKTGPGMLALNNSESTFSGTWAINAGTLNINDDTNLGAAGAKLSVSGAVVNVANAWNTSRPIALQGSGMTLNVGSDSTLSGVISGTGSLTKIGTSNVVISGANTYSGATTISAGTLTAGAPNSIPSSSAVVLQGATTVVATLNLNGNAQSLASLASIGATGNVASVLTGGADLTIGSDNTTTQFRGNIDGGGNGAFTKVGTGLLELTGVAAGSGAESPNHTINMASIHVAGGILQYDNIAPNLLALPDGTITVDSGASISLGGTGGTPVVTNLVTGQGGLQFHGGTIEIDTDNDYTGPTEMRFQSTVIVGSMNALGSDSAPVISKPVTLAFANSNTLRFPVGGTFSKPIVSEGGSMSLEADPGTEVTFNGVVSGGSVFYGLFTTAASLGTDVLNAANTNTGFTYVHPAASTLKFGPNGLLSPNSELVVNGTFDLSTGQDQTCGSLIGLNTGQVILGPGRTLTMGTDNKDTTGISASYPNGYAGVLTGAGGITKVGGGLGVMTLTYNAAELPWTGPTHVMGGGLKFNTDSRTANGTSGYALDANTMLLFNFTTAGSGATTPVISVPITGAGTVEKDGTDPLLLTGSNSYTGGTRIGGGTLIVNADNNLGADPISSSPQNIVFSGAGTLKFGTPFTLNANRGISLAAAGTIDTNGADLAIAGPIAGVGGFSKAGLGTLTVNNINSGGAIAVNAGNLTVLAQGGAANANKASAVTVAAGSKLDLTDNKLVVTGTTLGAWNGTAYTGVTGQIVAGRNGGSWDGSSVVTSMSLANSAPQLTTLAVAGASDISKTTFGGLSVNPTDVLVMYTYNGDTNLDGKINGDDYFRIDNGYTSHLTGYENGDLNYDGRIDADDYFLIDRDYVEQGTPFAAGATVAASPGDVAAVSASSIQAVPEPASLAMISLGAMTILSRRRRRA